MFEKSAENNHGETVKVLLQNGALPNILDSRKYTALDVARRDDIKSMLQSAGGKESAQSSSIEKNAVKLLPTKILQ